jgi:hypothetical protein
MAKLSVPLTLLGAAILTLFAWRAASDEHRRTRERPADVVVDGAALVLLAGLTSLWLFGKVFSPQYLTWALPIVLALSDRIGRKVRWIYLGTLVVTQVYLRGYYDEVYNQSAVGVVTILVRQGLIAALAVTSLRPLGSRPRAFGALSKERAVAITSHE